MQIKNTLAKITAIALITTVFCLPSKALQAEPQVAVIQKSADKVDPKNYEELTYQELLDQQIKLTKQHNDCLEQRKYLQAGLVRLTTALGILAYKAYGWYTTMESYRCMLV